MSDELQPDGAKHRCGEKVLYGRCLECGKGESNPYAVEGAPDHVVDPVVDPAVDNPTAVGNFDRPELDEQ